jgi:alpha-glucosidase
MSKLFLSFLLLTTICMLASLPSSSRIKYIERKKNLFDRTLSLKDIGGVSPVAQISMGNVKSIEKNSPDEYSIQISCENGNIRLSFLKENIVRVHMAPVGKQFPGDELHTNRGGPYAVIKYDWSPGVKYTIHEETNRYLINAGEYEISIDKNPFRLHFYNQSGNLIFEELIGSGLSYDGNKVRQTIHSSSEEHFIGGGGHKHPLDLKGSEMVCTASELGETDEGGGFPVPWFMSSKGYGIFFNNLSPDATLDFKEKNSYTFHATSGEKEGWDMDYYIFYGPKIEKIIKGYLEVVGKPCLPEKWYFGYMQSECCGGDPEVKNRWAELFRKNKWPADVFIEDLQGLSYNMNWNTPDYPLMLKNIHEKGFKYGTSLPLFRDWWKWSEWDPSDSTQRQSYADTLKKRVAEGLDFVWMDNSERADYWTKKTTLNGYPLKNLYGSLWSTSNIKAFEECGLVGRPSISRGGHVGGHRYNVAWPGDISVGVERLDTDLDWFKNSGLSGYVSTTVDLSGFWLGDEDGSNNIDVTGIWEPKTGKFSGSEHVNRIRRFINVLMVYPIARMHGGCISEPDSCFATKPWNLSFGEEKLFRHFINLRYQLLPYIYSSAIEGHLTGRPILASLVWDYQNDKNVYKQDYEFMFGKNMLVAPVICREKVYKTPVNKWDVYLPANTGEWIHYWSGKKYNAAHGKTITISAPLEGKDGLPLFIKEGAIIPMMPLMQYVNERSVDPLILEIFPKAGSTSNYTYYDAQHGTKLLPVPVLATYSATDISCIDTRGGIDVLISESGQSYELAIHMNSKPVKVKVDGKYLNEFIKFDLYKREAGNGFYFGRDNLRGTNFKIPTLFIKVKGSKGKKHKIEIEKIKK